MKNDKVIFESRKTLPKAAESGENFAWDPRADQVFTPDDGAHNGQLIGAAASFDKDKGYSFIAMGTAHIVANDEGTTTWGRVVDSEPEAWPTVIETSSPEGEVVFASRGKLVVGDPSGRAELRVYHANGDADLGPLGMALAVRDVVLSNAVVDIKNGSVFQMAGSEFGDFSSLTIDVALITVRNGSACDIVPNAGDRRIAVNGALQVIVEDDSIVHMDAASWLFSKGGEVRFSLAGKRRGTSGPDSKNYCYLGGFDFLSSTYYPPGMFNFLTEDAEGPLLTNHGEFVFPNIGNGFQWASMLQKKLIAIDGVIVTDSRLIPDDFTNGDLHIHLKGTR